MLWQRNPCYTGPRLVRVGPQVQRRAEAKVDTVRDYRRWLEPSPAFRSIDGHDKLRRVVAPAVEAPGEARRLVGKGKKRK